MKKIYTKILCFAVACSFAACDDFLSEYSQDMVVAKSVDHLDEVLLGSVYVPAFSVYNPSGITSCGFFNILDDDINTATGSDITKTVPYNLYTNTDENFGYFTWQAEVGLKRDGNRNDDHYTWEDMYKRINYVNVILDEIEQMPRDTEKDLATYYRVKGEAHFLRGQFYLILTNLYGKPYHASTAAKNLSVPLKLTPYVEHDPQKDTQFERATVKAIFDQIVSDLTASVEFLTISPQNAKNRFHRASVEAANLLLSRVYLYMQEWSLAEAAADEVIKSKNFRLAELSALADEVDFLNKENPEAIFSQGQNNLPQSQEDGWLPISGYAGSYCVSSDLGNLYDQENDRRYACFFGITPPGSQIGECDSLALHNKFEARREQKARYSDVFGLRLSEAYLNKMEACAMLGHTEEANDLLNTLREKRIDNYVAETYSGAELVSQIRDERRKELCFEGHRWFDLRRYAVNDLYPFKKQIVHVMNVVNSKGDQNKTMTYILEEDDLAYTFALPKNVIEFDKVHMENNQRETRKSWEELHPEVDEEGEVIKPILPIK